MNTRSANRERLSALQDAVFNNDLIRDLIVDYVVHDKNKAVISEVRSARQVSKSWLHSVSRSLRKTETIIFRIPLTHENSTSGTAYVRKHRKVLDQFEKVLTRGVKHCYPSYSIDTSASFFRKYNHQKLMDILAKYGSSLVELHLSFEEKQILKPLKCGTSLSSLQVLRLCVTRTKHLTNALDFVQSVFDACGERLVALTWSPVTDRHPPIALSNLILPKSATQLTLVCPLLENHLDVLLKNTLPNLKTLTLKGSIFPTTGGQVSNILENHRQTLKSFNVFEPGITPTLPPHPPSTLTIPVMPSLQFFELETTKLELARDGLAMHRFLPAVTRFTFTMQTPAMFRKWTSNSRFESVTSLTAFLFNPTPMLTESSMALVPTAFPNLRTLTFLTAPFQASLELATVWKHLTGLRELTIAFLSLGFDGDQHFWDEIFTGFSKNRLKAFKRSRKPWKEPQSLPTTSIRNLTNLEELHLMEYMNCESSLISDATFRLAFLKMPKLSKLVLVGSFSASEEMTKMWMNEGRSIKYTQ